MNILKRTLKIFLKSISDSIYYGVSLAGSFLFWLLSAFAFFIIIYLIIAPIESIMWLLAQMNMVVLIIFIPSLLYSIYKNIKSFKIYEKITSVEIITLFSLTIFIASTLSLFFEENSTNILVFAIMLISEVALFILSSKSKAAIIDKEISAKELKEHEERMKNDIEYARKYEEDRRHQEILDAISKKKNEFELEKMQEEWEEERRREREEEEWRDWIWDDYDEQD